MDLYEPLGDQKDVVDAPKTNAKDAPMMPPMKESKPEHVENMTPLRCGDDVDLQSDPARAKRKDGSRLTWKSKSSNSCKSSVRKRKTAGLIAQISIVLLCCIVFVAMTSISALHLFDVMDAIQLFTAKCPIHE